MPKTKRVGRKKERNRDISLPLPRVLKGISVWLLVRLYPIHNSESIVLALGKPFQDFKQLILKLLASTTVQRLKLSRTIVMFLFQLAISRMALWKQQRKCNSFVYAKYLFMFFFLFTPKKVSRKPWTEPKLSLFSMNDYTTFTLEFHVPREGSWLFTAHFPSPHTHTHTQDRLQYF